MLLRPIGKKIQIFFDNNRVNENSKGVSSAYLNYAVVEGVLLQSSTGLTLYRRLQHTALYVQVFVTAVGFSPLSEYKKYGSGECAGTARC